MDTCGADLNSLLSGLGSLSPEEPFVHLLREYMEPVVIGNANISNTDLIAWLIERRENCERIARTKKGEDRAGWLEDAYFFDAAIHAVRGYERFRTVRMSGNAKE